MFLVGCDEYDERQLRGNINFNNSALNKGCIRVKSTYYTFHFFVKMFMKTAAQKMIDIEESLRAKMKVISSETQ